MQYMLGADKDLDDTLAVAEHCLPLDQSAEDAAMTDEVAVTDEGVILSS